jgi:hypothetical protein
VPIKSTKMQKKEETPVLSKIDTKFVQSLGKYGLRVDAPGARAYFFPYAIAKPASLPTGIYQVIKLSDLPDEILANFGLQKIPANENP